MDVRLSFNQHQIQTFTNIIDQVINHISIDWLFEKVFLYREIYYLFQGDDYINWDSAEYLNNINHTSINWSELAAEVYSNIFYPYIVDDEHIRLTEIATLTPYTFYRYINTYHLIQQYSACTGNNWIYHFYTYQHDQRTSLFLALTDIIQRTSTIYLIEDISDY